jgi:hypothetical protein
MLFATDIYNYIDNKYTECDRAFAVGEAEIAMQQRGMQLSVIHYCSM